MNLINLFKLKIRYFVILKDNIKTPVKSNWVFAYDSESAVVKFLEMVKAEGFELEDGEWSVTSIDMSNAHSGWFRAWSFVKATIKGLVIGVVPAIIILTVLKLLN